jgi:hypothetical protein
VTGIAGRCPKNATLLRIDLWITDFLRVFMVKWPVDGRVIYGDTLTRRFPAAPLLSISGFD